MSKTLFLLFFIFTHVSWSASHAERYDDEDWVPKSDEVHVYRKVLDPSRAAFGFEKTGWVNAHLGHCVGVRQRLLWWFYRDVYIINVPSCEQIEQRAAGRLYLGKEARLRCVVRHNPYTTITFGKKSSALVLKRLLECDQEWSTIGVREAMKYAMDPLSPEDELQRQSLHETWLQNFQASLTPLKYPWREPSCGTKDLLKDILMKESPKTGFKFQFSTASFENCKWKYGDVLGKTVNDETNALLMLWIGKDNCKLEVRTNFLPLDNSHGKELAVASILLSYVVWSDMLTENVSLIQVMESITGSLHASQVFPPEISTLVQNRVGSLSYYTTAKERDEVSHNVLRMQDGRTTGVSARMSMGLPFLIYDPVCLEIWQSEGILIQNDNPLSRLMSHPEFVQRIKQYGEPYIRAMIAYLMEIFLTMKDEAVFYMQNPLNFRTYYGVLPRVNWQGNLEAKPLHRKDLPEKMDFNLYTEGLKIFKREFAKEITDAGVEFASNAWKDLTSHFRSPRKNDFFRTQQELVKMHTTPPFIHNEHVYIVCEFQGVSFRGLMSGKLNLLMMRGLSDASHFRFGETYLYPDLLKLDKILERVENLQNTRFDRQCQPILRPLAEIRESNVQSFEIETIPVIPRT